MDIDREILNYADTIGLSEAPVYDPDLPDDPAELWKLINRAAAIQRAAGETRKQLKTAMGAWLAGRKVVYGDTLVRYAAIPTTRVIDPQGFWDWATVNVEPEQWRLLVNPNMIKKGALKTLFGETVIDTFFHTEWDHGLTEVPRSRWPKFAERMREGEVT